MSTEIERKYMHNQPQPDPIQTLNGVAVMQAMTLGFLVASQIVMSRRMLKLMRMSTVKEVVVVYKEVKEEIA